MRLWSSHSGYLLYHPCFIWFLDISCGFLRSRCLEFYGTLRGCVSDLQCSPCLGVRRYQFSRRVASWIWVLKGACLAVLQGTSLSETLVLCMRTWKFICRACGIYDKLKYQMFIIFADLRWTRYSCKNLFSRFFFNNVGFKNSSFVSGYKP